MLKTLKIVITVMHIHNVSMQKPRRTVTKHKPQFFGWWWDCSLLYFLFMLFWIFQIPRMNMYYFCNQIKLTSVIGKYAFSLGKQFLLLSRCLAWLCIAVRVLTWRRLQQIDFHKYLWSTGRVAATVVRAGGGAEVHLRGGPALVPACPSLKRPEHGMGRV